MNKNGLFHTCSLLDFIPENLRKDTQIQSIAKAFDKQFEKIKQEAEIVQIWYNIDKLDHKVLDFIALELNTHFYDTTFTLEKKRQLLKKCLAWYYRLGTKDILEEIISSIYQDFKVEEWFEYDGEPFFFKVNINLGQAGLNQDEFMKLNHYIHYAKNARSWLEQIRVNSEIPQNEMTIGSTLACNYSRAEINIDMPNNLNLDFNNTISKLTGVATEYSRTELPIKALEDLNINSNVDLPSKITTNYIRTEVIE